MNKRIKKLVEQTNCWQPLGLPSNWDEGDYVVSPEQMEKFAELIVRDCENYLVYAMEIQNQQEQNLMELAARKLKQHFGIEE